VNSLESLDTEGYAVWPGFLAPSVCQEVAAYYEQPSLFRSRVIMSRHGFGRGEYQYFDYPILEPIASLCISIYPSFVSIANA